MIISFASCANTEACYEITATAMGYSASSYVLGTQSDVDAAVKAAQTPGVTVTYKKVSKSKSDCVGMAY